MKTPLPFFAFLAFLCGQTLAAAKPNILLIYTDDQEETDCMGANCTRTLLPQ